MARVTSVKIVETVESGEPVPSIPEWIWNPSIQVRIIRGWGIVSYNWRALAVIIVIYYRWFVILRIILRRCNFCRRLFSLGILSFSTHPDW